MNTLSVEVLRRNKTSSIFVETGTAKGEGIAAALEVGFEKVYSIEVIPEVFARASLRFENDPRVDLWLGDSRDALPMVLERIKEPAVFWIDAHWSTGETVIQGASRCTALHDIRAIGRHGVKGHTILVDDIRYFRGAGLAQWGQITLDEIQAEIMEIDAGYAIHFEDGVIANDILVARLENPHE